MASIPLSVLLAPQPQGPLDQANAAAELQSRMQQVKLKSLLTPGQIYQQQDQENQIRQQTITQGQQSIAARQALNQAYAGAVTKDANGLPTFDREKITSALAQSNQGAEIPEVMKGLQAMDQQAATIQDLKDKHTTTATDYLGAAAKTVQDSKYDPNVISLVLQHASQAGFSQEAQQVQQLLQQNPQAAKPVFDHLYEQSTAQQKLKTEQEQADAAKLRAQNTSPSDAGLALRASQGDPAAIAALKTIQDQAVAKAAATAEAEKSTKIATAGGEETARLNAQAKFGVQSDAMVDEVGTGKMDLTTALSRVPFGAKDAFISQLKAKYPDFNQANYSITKGVMKDFTSGDAAKNLTAFNTAIEHAKQLNDAADALQNGNTVALNKIGNALGYQFGSDKTTNFNVIKNALSGEISKVFKGGQATDAEIREVQGPFNAANSPAQLKGAIQNAIALMNSKRGALQQQYQQGIKAQPNFGNQTGGFQLPPGTPTAVGPNGHRIAAVGGKWVDAQTGQPIQ